MFLRRFIIFGPSNNALALFYLTRKLSTPVKGNIPRGLRNTGNGGSFELQIKTKYLNNKSQGRDKICSKSFLTD